MNERHKTQETDSNARELTGKDTLRRQLSYEITRLRDICV